MTIAFPKPPGTAVEMATSAVSGSGPIKLRRAESQESVLLNPHAIYNVGLEDIAAGKDVLRAAHQTGWRFLLGDSTRRVIAAAEVRTDADGKPESFDHVNTGPFASSTAHAAEVAEDTSATTGLDYEFAVMRVPALYVMGVWLRAADDDTRDVVIPLAPAPSFLTVGRTYTAKDFTEALRRPAQELLAAFKRLGEEHDPTNDP